MKKIITLVLVLAATTFVARAQSNTTAASSVNKNPIYTPKGTAGTNPLAADAKAENPLYEPSSSTTVNPLFESQARTAGQPIGGIVVKGGQNGLETANPIPGVGVVVKHNEQKTVSQPNPVKSDKGISEKGIK